MSQSDSLDPVTISEHEGVRYLHLGTPWVQGAMRLDQPDQLELQYVQQMMMWQLFMDQPEHIAQLGLGAASLTKFCYQHYPNARVTAIELNPDVIRACHHLFELPPNDERLNVIQSCAFAQLQQWDATSVDVLQVDLYSANADNPALESLEFYQECARVLTEDGLLTVNILGNEYVHARNLHHLQQHFAAVAWLPESHDGNIVAIAFKNPPAVDFDELYARATQITMAYGLPASEWVEGLEAWMQGD